MTTGRTRRDAEDSKQRILDAAATLLTDGGVAAVTVRAVARRVEMTDAGVNHHFGNRRQLLEALLRNGGRRLRDAVDAVLTRWLDDEADVAALVTALAEVYRDGYAELALSLHAAGWRDRSSGLLEPVVSALHAHRPSDADITDTRLAVAALHQAIALDSVFGTAFRRSAGITDDAVGAADQLRWWSATLSAMVGEPVEPMPRSDP